MTGEEAFFSAMLIAFILITLPFLIDYAGEIVSILIEAAINGVNLLKNQVINIINRIKFNRLIGKWIKSEKAINKPEPIIKNVQVKADSNGVKVFFELPESDPVAKKLMEDIEKGQSTSFELCTDNKENS